MTVQNQNRRGEAGSSLMGVSMKTVYAFGTFPPEVVKKLTREACERLSSPHSTKTLRALCRAFMAQHPVQLKAWGK